MEKNKVTLKRIAQALGISMVSVSKALNGQPGVSAELRDKIIAYSKEIGYDINKKRLPNGAFCVVIPAKLYNGVGPDSFYHYILYQIEQLCNMDGINLLLRILSDSDENECIIPDIIKTKMVDGCFLLGQPSVEYFQKIVQEHLPMVAIDFYLQNMPIDHVVVDNYSASYELVSYLTSETKCKRIGYIGSPRTSSSLADRYFGYLKGLYMHDIPYDPALFIQWDCLFDEFENFEELSRRLPSPLPDALVCQNDHAAHRVLFALKMQQIAVPDTVAVTGFDNSEYTKEHGFLTTMEIDKQAVANMAFRLLMKRVGSPDAPVTKRVINAKLIIRDSTV